MRDGLLTTAKATTRRKLPRALALALPIVVVVAGASLAASSTAHKTVDVVQSATATATAHCKHKQALTGYGFSTVMDTNKGTTIKKLNPASRALTATATNVGVASGSLTATAYCATQPKRRPNPAPKTVSHSVAVAGSTTKSATATCPRHSVVRFGGFATSVEPGFGQKAVIARSAKRVSARRWKVTAHNEGTEAGTLKAIARCSRPLGLVTSTEDLAESAPSGGDATGTAHCPGHRRLLMAGFSATGDSDIGVYLDGLDRAGAHAASASTFNFVHASVTAIAYCH